MTMFSSLPSSGHYQVSTGMRISGTAHSNASHGDSESINLSRSAPIFVKNSTYNNNKEKPVLSPPVFVFQRFASMKRRAEDDINGPTVSKRVRSFTYPNINGRSRRATVGAPCIRVKRTLLRPAVLLAPKPRRDRQHLQVSLNSADDLDRVSIDQQTSTSAYDQLSSCSADSSHVKLERPNQSSIQFVFGENMSERVLNPLKSPYSEEVSDSDSSSSDSESSSPDTSHNSTVKRSLWESAAATTASCRRHCLLKQVQVITGEERESNVVQLSCKLFVLERGTQSWSERGRGILRLNDLATGNRGELQSRIVMRHQGSLKLILNTKLWPHTQLKRPARRNLQVTATDLESHAIRVFLIQAGARDITRLHAAIHHRLVGMHCRAGLRDRNGSSDDEDERGDCRKDTQEAWSP
ncbi:ran-binding protein 3-like isoform X4 [Sardina pilchardus]|uniref:ran-binding protein 3-like isoform X4 n=1 Tax=Sardina pilchardus TaxID=27697 RepID=UPI002E139D97